MKEDTSTPQPGHRARSSVSPAWHRLMLLEGAVTSLRSLREAIETGDEASVAECGDRCRAILMALGVDTDTRVEHVLARRLAALHSFLHGLLAQATRTADLDDVLEILEFQRDAWREAVVLLRRNDAGTSSIEIEA
ncbi:MAG: flagellar export chaperone FliS [Planctomycetota bacterium]|nr:flagellar export chaperone FliS [Planctomycetota bacterium]